MAIAFLKNLTERDFLREAPSKSFLQDLSQVLTRSNFCWEYGFWQFQLGFVL